jgi:hypothetical protein
MIFLKIVLGPLLFNMYINDLCSKIKYSRFFYFPDDLKILRRIACIVDCLLFQSDIKGKGKAIPVTGREGPEGCETSRLPHFLDNRLTDGGEAVSLTRRPPVTSRKISGTHFC